MNADMNSATFSPFSRLAESVDATQAALHQVETALLAHMQA